MNAGPDYTAPSPAFSWGTAVLRRQQQAQPEQPGTWIYPLWLNSWQQHGSDPVSDIIAFVERERKRRP